MGIKRLTRYGNTTHGNGVCCTHFNSAECAELQGNCSYGCQWEEKAWEKLAHYEDLEEQGRLIELPCAVGDTVYDIADKKIRKQIVDGIEYMADGFFIYANEDEWLGRLGDLVFLTKAEAEAALKESEKECINLL